MSLSYTGPIPQCPFCRPPVALHLTFSAGEDVEVVCTICGMAGTLTLQEVERAPDGRQPGPVPVIQWANTNLRTQHPTN